MACEAEQTNVELLELLEEMAEREKDEAFQAVNEAMRELSDSCGGHFMYPNIPDAYNVWINVPTLAEFLHRLENGELSPECEQRFDDVVRLVDEANELVERRDRIQAAHEEARSRLRDCMHDSRTGTGGS